MKRVFAIVALCISSSAFALPADMCYSLARVAETVAEARDTGTSEASTGAAVIRATQAGMARDTMLRIVHVTYSSKKSPRQSSDAMLKSCSEAE